MPLLFLLVSTVWAACPAPTFTFHGQPDCLSLVFAGSHTLATSTCDAPILVDQSVLLHPTGGLLLSGTTTALRDLSAFTLGMEGQIYQVVAALETCEEASPMLAAQAP